jgi:hypothetical protein
MDATFIVDREYDSFSSLWVDFVSVQSMVNPDQPPFAESVQISLSPKIASAWLDRKTEANSIGWRFVGEPTDDYLRQLQLQAAALAERNVPYRVACDPFGKAATLELRFVPPGSPHISIPLEDKVQNAKRFFVRYAEPMARATQTDEASVKSVLNDFCDHCVVHLEAELPFRAKFRQGLRRFIPKPKDLIWIPRAGHVGPHEIFTELHVLHPEDDVAFLSGLLAGLAAKDRTSPIRLFMQFFAEAHLPPPITISSPHLHEMTFQYGEMSFERIKLLLDALAASDVRCPVLDTFSIFEQRATNLGPPCHVTYTLRRTPVRGYEMRINTVWPSDEVNPETLVVDIEKRTGQNWNRIV